MTTVFSNIDNQAPVGFGPCAFAGNVAFLRAIRPSARMRMRGPRRIRSPRNTSDRIRRCLHSRSRPIIEAAAVSATATTRLLLRGYDFFVPDPYHALSQWRSIHASCPPACSARATTQQSARGFRSSMRRCWTWSPTKSRIYSAWSGRPIKRCCRTTWKASAR